MPKDGIMPIIPKPEKGVCHTVCNLIVKGVTCSECGTVPSEEELKEIYVCIAKW